MTTTYVIHIADPKDIEVDYDAGGVLRFGKVSIAFHQPDLLDEAIDRIIGLRYLHEVEQRHQDETDLAAALADEEAEGISFGLPTDAGTVINVTVLP